MVSKTQRNLVKIPLPLQPRNDRSTLGRGGGGQARCQTQAFQALQGRGGTVLRPQLPTAASHEITGSNRRGEEGRFSQLKKHQGSLPKVTEQFTAEQPKTPGRSTPSLCLGFERISKLFLVAELFFLSFIFLHF